MLSEFDGTMWFDSSVKFTGNQTNALIELMSRHNTGAVFYVSTTGHSIITATHPTMLEEQETRNNFAPEQGEEKASLEDVHSIPSYRPKLRVFIKGKIQPKASGKETSELFPKEDGSSGFGGNVDKPHGSGTSGQLTAPKTTGEKKQNNSAGSHDDNEMMSSFFTKLLENGPNKGTKTK